eukprot:4899119-Pyramimonas_sp.AAC.1
MGPPRHARPAPLLDLGPRVGRAGAERHAKDLRWDARPQAKNIPREPADLSNVRECRVSSRIKCSQA